ncbi:hypothetical protein D5086_006267, partial [Populus alba]
EATRLEPAWGAVITQGAIGTPLEEHVTEDESLVQPPEEGQREGAGEPNIDMGFFLRGAKTLASLEKFTKSTKATFDRGGIEVGDGDCTV